MNDTDQIKLFLSAFAGQIPILIVSMVGCVVILVKWAQAPRGSLWALLALALSLILCVAIPITQTAVQTWAIRGGAAMATRASVFTGVAFFWSVLRAITYILLLVAVYAGRPRATTE